MHVAVFLLGVDAGIVSLTSKSDWGSCFRALTLHGLPVLSKLVVRVGRFLGGVTLCVCKVVRGFLRFIMIYIDLHCWWMTI